MADTNGINGSGSNLPAPHNIGLTRASDNGVVSTNQNPFLLSETKGTTSPTTVSDIKEIRKEVKTLTDLAKQYLLSGEKVPDSVKAALKSANDKKDAASEDKGITGALGAMTDKLGMFSKLSESLPGMSKTPAIGSGKEISSAIAEGMKSLPSEKKEGSETKDLMAMMDDNQLVEYEGMKQAFSDATKGLLGPGSGGLFDGMAESLSEVLPIDDILGTIGEIAKIATQIFGAVTNIMSTVESRMTMVVDAQAEMAAYFQTLSDAPGARTYWSHIEQAMGGTSVGHGLLQNMGPLGILVGGGIARFLKATGIIDTAALQGTGLMTYQEYLNSMKTVAKTGYLKDLEGRTFIDVMKEQLLPAFNVTNSTLYRILRLVDSGNSDSTYQRLAIQTYLTRYLNEYYEDSEYIQSQFASIESALLDSIAVKGSEKVIGNEETLTYEATVQAWTAAMYNSGVSSGVISNIAKGIDYLASGNIEALSQNETLMNFFAIAAAKSNLSIADMLINGLDNSEIYSMLETIVRYLSEISISSNNVVRSEYAKIFGMSVADMVGVQNFVEGGGLSTLLKAKPLSEYGSTSREFSEQLYAMFNPTAFVSYKGSRITAQSYLANMLDNTLTETALNFGNNLYSYTSYKMASVVGNIADAVSVVFPFAKIVSVAAKLSQVIKVFTELTSSIQNTGVAFLTETVRGAYASDVYNRLTGRDLAQSGLALVVSKAQSIINSTLSSIKATNSDSIAAVNEQAEDVKKANKEAQNQAEAYIQEQKEKSSAEVIESSTDEESVVRIGMFNSDALFQLRRAISEVLENAGIIQTGASASYGESGGQSSVQSMLVSDRNAKIADLVHSINDSMWAIAQNLSTKEGDNIGQMIKEIASDVDTIQRDVDGVSDNMALVTNKYIMS